MLARDEGASGPQIAATHRLWRRLGWAGGMAAGKQPRRCWRPRLAALAEKGITVEALARVRQIGSNTKGAKAATPSIAPPESHGHEAHHRTSALMTSCRGSPAIAASGEPFKSHASRLCGFRKAGRNWRSVRSTRAPGQSVAAP